MPTKTVTYPWTFNSAVVRAGREAMTSQMEGDVLGMTGPHRESCRLERRGVTWVYDDLEEYLADLDSEPSTGNYSATWSATGDLYDLSLTQFTFGTQVSIKHKTRAAVESVSNAVTAQLKLRPEITTTQSEPEPLKPRVFLGHGRNEIWQRLYNTLRDDHGIEVRAYETGSRTGHTIRDILEGELTEANFAIIVMTAEDPQADGEHIRARQNVVHEAGLFQGRLGFPKVAILVESGVENFSNIDGIQYIPFTTGNIRETVGDVLAHIRREFPIP